MPVEFNNNCNSGNHSIVNLFLSNMKLFLGLALCAYGHGTETKSSGTKVKY
jgi:hypothetical protein